MVDGAKPRGRSLRPSLLLVLLLAMIALAFNLSRRVTVETEQLLPVDYIDKMDDKTKVMVGPDAIECGWVKVGKSPEAATNCVLKANSEGKPFRVRYDLMGIDSNVAFGLVRSPDGQVWGVRYDGVFSQSWENFWVTPCPQPPKLRVSADGRANCFPNNPEAKDTIVAPDFGSY